MGWSRFFRRGRWDDERAQELQDYLAHEIDDNIARGMTPDEAAAAAHRRLGNATQIREEIYDMNTLRFVETIWQDLRYGFRLLRKQPDVRDRRDPDARARHRRQRRDLPTRELGAAAHAARSNGRRSCRRSASTPTTRGRTGVS